MIKLIYAMAMVISTFSAYSQAVEVDSETPLDEPDSPDHDSGIFVVVEVPPIPVGGMGVFYEHFLKNLKYPKTARKAGIEGKVFVQFVVERDGSITEVKTIKGIGGGCDEEAERVVRLSPKWSPGMQRGRPVRVMMVLPINFNLGAPKKTEK